MQKHYNNSDRSIINKQSVVILQAEIICQRKKNGSLFYHIMLFVMAQLAWLLLLGLWIFWYVTNYVGLENIAYAESKVLSKYESITVLVSGILLLITITIILSMIFTFLNRQLNLTNLYDSFIANVTS